MRYSLILPCFNELRHDYLHRILTNLLNQQINQRVDQQVNQACEKEIIAIASPSDDGTEALLDDYARQFAEIKFVRSLSQNRAQRINEGIAISTGDIVIIHHPATLLPEVNALDLVEQAWRSGAQWGCFSHSFDQDHWLLRFTSWYSNHVRVRRKGIVYFDHCPFVTRQLLNQVGNVPDLDIFEDTVFSDRLNKLAKPDLIEAQVITSARRFQQRGIYRHALLNQWLKLCYHLNIDPRSLNRLYEQKASINVKYNDS